MQYLGIYNRELDAKVRLTRNVGRVGGKDYGQGTQGTRAQRGSHRCEEQRL